MSNIEFTPGANCRVVGCFKPAVVVRHLMPGEYRPDVDAHLCDEHRDVLVTEAEVRAFTMGWEAGQRRRPPTPSDLVHDYGHCKSLAGCKTCEAEFAAVVERVMCAEGWVCNPADHDGIPRPGECINCDRERHRLGFRLYAALTFPPGKGGDA